MSDRISKNVRHLSDAWYKAQTSNNAKMLALNELSIKDVRAVIKQIDDSLDIYKATGKTLDLYGDSVGQKRGILNDLKFRLLILSKVAVNVSGVDYQTVLNNILKVLGCTCDDFDFIEMQDSGEPATVRVTNMPYDVLDKIGFSSNEVYQIIKMLLPIGVRLEFYDLQGTFEFCSIEDYPLVVPEKSFSDEGMTFGGTWGMVIGEDDQLPIQRGG